MATKLPSIPDISESSLKRAVIALKEIIEVGIERRGDPLDRFVKLRELLTLLEEDSQVSSILNTALGTEFSADGEILVGTGSGTFQAESGATLRTSVGCDPIGTDNSTDVTLDGSAITGGLSIIGQDISNQAATDSQNGYVTSTQITKLDGIAALADVTGSNTPQAHKVSHQNGGTDEISIAGLSGVLVDDQHIIDAEAVSAMGVKGDSNPLNHDIYLDADAISAMGAKADVNPLNHDIYTDAEAKAAAVQSGAITNGVTLAPTHDAVFDVKTTADAAQTAGEVDSTIATHTADIDAHHAKYTDVEAKSAAVQSGAIANGVTKAPTHDAVYDVKVTADAAQTSAEVVSLIGSTAPKAHSASHTDGSDDIQSATSGQKGLATSTQITKLDGIEALADVTSTYETSHADVLVDGDVDDTPVDAATTAPISSNWAYDHDNDANAHHTQNADTALGAQSENLDMNTHKIVGVTDPDDAQDAATKQYVDDNGGGAGALDDLSDAKTPATDNLFIGTDAGRDNTTGNGNYNVGIGISAMQENETGDGNTIIGYESGKGVADSSYSNNTIMGYQSGYDLTTSPSNVMIGYQAGYTLSSGTGSNTIMGYQAGLDLTTGGSNVLIGRQAGENLTTGAKNVIIGEEAGSALAAGDDGHVLIGYQAGLHQAGSAYNVIVGYKSGEDLTTGSQNVFLGYNSGNQNVTGSYNVIIGYQAGQGQPTKSYSNNVFIGNLSGFGAAIDGADNNVGIGASTLFSVTTADDNVCIGEYAGHDLTTGGSNVLIGRQAGENVTTGAENVIVGSEAGSALTAGDDGNVIIGHNAGKTHATGSNELWVDNGDNAVPLIKGDFATGAVSLNGNFTNASQPAFNALLTDTQSNVTGDGTVYNIIGAIWTEIVDQGSNFSDGTFTAPVTGIYSLAANVYLQELTAAHLAVSIRIVTSNREYALYYSGASPLTGSNILSGAIIADMDINDTAFLRVTVSNGTKIVDIYGTAWTYFSGVLIC